MSQVHNNQQCKGVKGVSVNPLNTLVGMTRGVGYFVKGLNPQTSHKYGPATM